MKTGVPTARAVATWSAWKDCWTKRFGVPTRWCPSNDDSKPTGPELDEEQRQAIARDRRTRRAEVRRFVATIGPAITCSAMTRWSPWKEIPPPTCSTRTPARRAFSSGAESTSRRCEPPIRRSLLSDPAERDLALELVQLGDAIDKMLEDYRPNILTAYLFSLATKFSRFFQNCHVLTSGDGAAAQQPPAAVRLDRTHHQARTGSAGYWSRRQDVMRT